MNSANEKWFDETTSNSFLFASATQDELSVSQILLGLENLTPFPRFIWGCRKRRSCLDAAPSAPASVPIAEEEIEVRRSLAEEAAAAAATSSPATPLSFSPSEPDGKSKRSSKKILKKRALKTRQSKEESQRDMGRFLNLGIDFIQHDETIKLLICSNSSVISDCS
ncbi:uncharacterized protein LOC142544655 isoform X2 [Primulina tabacum]|uniref:uncharacterized protein LOC142544655 isoform X2 n=1 Tax=Primulina tabacum TaxID=48773 RepID=UPI003F5AB478